MAEWTNAAVSKTVASQGAVGSNPTSSAIVNQAVSANVCGGKTVVPQGTRGSNPLFSAVASP